MAGLNHLWHRLRLAAGGDMEQKGARAAGGKAAIEAARQDAAPHPANVVGRPGSAFEPGITAGFTLKEHSDLPFTTNWDPRDYEWAPPSDEDEPWATGPPKLAKCMLALSADGLVDPVVVAETARQSASKGGVATLAGKAARGKCLICLADHRGDRDTVAFECEQHFYCVRCAADLIKHKVGQNEEPICAHPGCGGQVPIKVAKRILSKEMFSRYLLRRLLASGAIQTCPSCQEKVFIFDDMEGQEDQEKSEPLPSTRCPCCESRFCRSCGCQWNSQHICTDSKGRQRRRERRQNSRRFAKLAEEMDLRKCPACGVPCEKVDEESCDHMRCIKCLHEFCWTCLADRKVIEHHGNHYHRSTCRFYAAYDGSDRIRMEKKCKKCQEQRKPCVPPGEHI